MTVSLCIRQGSKRNDDSVSVEELDWSTESQVLVFKEIIYNFNICNLSVIYHYMETIIGLSVSTKFNICASLHMSLPSLLKNKNCSTNPKWCNQFNWSWWLKKLVWGLKRTVIFLKLQWLHCCCPSLALPQPFLCSHQRVTLSSSSVIKYHTHTVLLWGGWIKCTKK